MNKLKNLCLSLNTFHTKNYESITHYLRITGIISFAAFLPISLYFIDTMGSRSSDILFIYYMTTVAIALTVQYRSEQSYERFLRSKELREELGLE